MSNFHLRIFAPNTRQVVDKPIVHFSCLFKDDSRFCQLLVLFIKLGEFHPERVRFPRSQLGFHGLNCFCVRVDNLLGLSLEEFHSLVPLMHIVGVLSKKDTKNKNKNLKKV